MSEQNDIETGTDIPLLKEAQKRWRDVRESNFEKNWRTKAIEDLKYFTGEDQGWDDKGDRDKLEQDERPALTLNRIHGIIRLMCGARPKTDGRFLAVEESDIHIADILNSCKEHVEQINRWEFELNDWFLKGVILSRWAIEISIDNSVEKQGEIYYKPRDGFELWLDPNSKLKDRSDMEYMFEEIVCTPAQAKRTWPQMALKIDEFVGHTRGTDDLGTPSRDSGLPDEYADSRANYYDPKTNMLTIPRYWYKKYTRINKLADLATGEIYDSQAPEEEIIATLASFAAPDRYELIPEEFVEVRYLTFIYDTVLEDKATPWQRPDGEDTLLSRNFPFVIFEPERIAVGSRNELLTVLDPMRDPQKFYNKLASAVLEMIGTAPKTGIDYEKGAIDSVEEEKLKSYGAKAGTPLAWEPGSLSGGKVHWRNVSNMPQAEMQEAKEMANALLDISGVESLVSTESLGKGSSGFAIDLKQKQGGNIISWIFDSFRFFQHILTEFTRDAIQILYDYQKVIRIKGTESQKFVTINEPIYSMMGEEISKLNDVTVGRYDVVITDKELMPTMRLERFRYFTELIKSGALPLPPPVLVQIVLHLLDDPELKQLVEEQMGVFQQAMASAQMQGGMPGAAPAGNTEPIAPGPTPQAAGGMA